MKFIFILLATILYHTDILGNESDTSFTIKTKHGQINIHYSENNNRKGSLLYCTINITDEIIDESFLLNLDSDRVIAKLTYDKDCNPAQVTIDTYGKIQSFNKAVELFLQEYIIAYKEYNLKKYLNKSDFCPDSYMPIKFKTN